MPSLAFWNFSKNDDVGIIVELIQRYGVEILVLAEQGFQAADLITEFARTTGSPLYSPGLGHHLARLSFYTQFPDDRFVDVFDSSYVSIKEYRPLIGDSLLIAAVHLPSKLHQDSKDFPFLAKRVRGWVDQAEKQVGHNRTVLVGDFNMNPFEDGMVASDAIHGVMDRRIAAKGTRSVLHEEHPYFYNPMWRVMGDSRSQMLGTYFLPSGNAVHYFWDTFDQVLIRPSLLPRFRDEDVVVLHELGARKLLCRSSLGIDKAVSDHLPLIFQLNT